MKVVQDSVGGWTNDWGTNVLWPGGVKWPALTTHPGRWDLLRFVDDGERWLGIVEGTDYRVPCGTNCSYALRFDNVQNSVRVPYHANFYTLPLTFEFWYKAPEDSPGFCALWFENHCHDYDGSCIDVSPSYAYIAIHDLPYGGFGNVPFDGQWHHIAFTVTTNTVESWLDGTLQTSETYSPPFTDSAADLEIGRPVCEQYWPYAYTLDEVRISSVVRYTNGFTPPARLTTDSDTVAHWRFNDGEGGTATDETNNHHGTLEGSPKPAWAEGR